jgi:hypothetical protein
MKLANMANAEGHKIRKKKYLPPLPAKITTNYHPSPIIEK